MANVITNWLKEWRNNVQSCLREKKSKIKNTFKVGFWNVCFLHSLAAKQNLYWALDMLGLGVLCVTEMGF